MHGSSQGIPVPITTYGGLVTLANPESLPDGASPRSYNMDFLIGSTKTRPGLENVYSVVNATVGPNGGGATATNSWSNPGNILANDGQYASLAIVTNSATSTTATASVTGSGESWSNPGNIDSPSAFAVSNLGSGGTSYTPAEQTATATASQSGSGTTTSASSAIGGLPSVTVTSTTISVSYNTTITSFLGGGSIAIQYMSDAQPTWTSILSAVRSGSQTRIFPSILVNNLSTLQLRLFATASVSSGGSSSAVGNITSWGVTVNGILTSKTLKAQITGLSIPAGATIDGIQVTMQGDATATAGLQLFWTAGATQLGSASFPGVPSSLGVITAGNNRFLWGYGGWTASTFSNLTLNILASAGAPCTVSLNNLSVQVFYTPAGNSQYLDVTEFGFNIPAANSPTGILASFTGYATAAATLTAQLLINGVPAGSAQTAGIPVSPGIFSVGSLMDLWGTYLTSDQANNTNFGIRITAVSTSTCTVNLSYVSLEIGLNTGDSNFNFITTFTAQNGDVKNLLLDAAGNLYVDSVTANPRTLTLVLEGIAANSFAVGVNGPDVEYLAFSDGFSGSDMPLQYTDNWIDRITQVGPAQAPVFTPSTASAVDYPIINITQPSPNPYGSAFAHGLQSSGPGSNSAGTVVTIYYADATLTSGDADLIAAFRSGYPVYLYASYTASSGGDTVGSLTSPAVFLVTSIGTAVPPNNSRQFYYFTYSVSDTQYVWNPGQEGFKVVYNRTLATLTTSEPVPQLTVGNQIVVSGNSVANWNNTWTVTETPNASDMVITQSSLTAGVATFSYATVNGTPAPQAGQLVTITNTLNAGGHLNVANWPIASVSGGATGTFTVSGFSAATDYSAAAEEGQATTAGTIFTFDPGAALVGTTSDPIYGTGTGGNLVFNPTGLFIDPGTYQGTVFFMTRNGYFTAPAPPVTFTVPENTTVLNVSQILIGPPNVIARGIAITEAGQNGVPGANFFTLPTPVQFYSNDTKYTATSFYVNDNVSTTASLFFTGAILDQALAIDTYGYNLFNQIEIGDPGWIVSYADRNFYGLCRNKVQNFNNLSFDGGYLPATTLIPPAWTTPDAYGSLTASPKFGNAYYIKNTSGGTLAVAGLISQTAYQDAYQQPIINANTPYSVRVTARIPSGEKTGNLVISLTANGVTYGSFTLPFASMATTYAIYSGTLLTTSFPTVPSTLILSVSATNIGSGADVEIDRVEVFPTAIPILTTTVYGSYAGLREQVDAVTGAVTFASENQQPVNGAVVMYDTFYALKGTVLGTSMYSLQASANLEPAQWQEPEVAQKSGSVGILAYDFGEQWIVMANRNGLYLFEGGQPGKISQEIYQVWDAINWSQAQCIWVRNDVVHRRLFIGVPMATPNFWLPNAPVNANPVSPNVILMCNYQGLDSGAALKSEPQMHTTMFGTLNAIDMRRKWNIWTIPSPYMGIVQSSTDEAIYLCNGVGNSKVYSLTDSSETDDGAAIDSLYTTAGLLEISKRLQQPALGFGRQRCCYMRAALESTGTVQVTLYPTRLLGPGDSTEDYAFWQLPGGFSPGNPAMHDVGAPLNFAATRTYIEFRENDGGTFNLSNLVVLMKKDVWNQIVGAK